MAHLGKQLERYEMNNRRRAITGVVALMVGLPVLAFGVFSIVVLSRGPYSAGMFFAGVIGACGLGLVIIGSIFGVRSLTRRGEYFALHEHGFVNGWNTSSHEVPWTDIATATDISKKSALARTLGGDVGCRIELNDGRVMMINAHTEGASLLAHRIYEATGTTRAE